MSGKLKNALVVDDDAGVCFILQQTLEQLDYKVSIVTSGEESLDVLRDTFYDVIVVDLNLGGRINGLRILEMAKWRWPETIVIILTGHASLDTALAAIKEGVDGYLVKPVNLADLRQTLQDAMTRRRNAPAHLDQNVVHFLDLTIDLNNHTVDQNGKKISLTPGEFRLLAYLMQHPGKVFSPLELVHAIREDHIDNAKEASEIVKWYIHGLRRKIEPVPSSPKYILNIRGVGYVLDDKK